MTPDERAEKISRCWQPELGNQVQGPCECPGCILRPRIVAEMEAYASERVEEARRQLIDGYDDTLAIKQAKAEAYEDAAKIFERAFSIGGSECDKAIALIRARAAEVGK